MPLSTHHTFSPDETRSRYQEPYVTEGLNHKLGGVVARGVYSGYNLGPNVAANFVTVNPPIGSATSVLVFEDSAGHSMTVRKPSGPFALDLTPQVLGVPVELVIAVYTAYTVGVPTVSTVRAYPVADYNASPDKPYLIVLGTVTLPAGGGVIPTVDITPKRRTDAWQNIPSGVNPWAPVLRNGGFIAPVVALDFKQHLIPLWTNYSTVPTAGCFVVSNTVGRNGIGSLAMNCLVGATPFTAKVTQGVYLPVNGKRLRYRLYERIDVAPTAGTARIVFTFVTTAGAYVTVTKTVPVSPVAAGFAELTEDFYTDPTHHALVEVALEFVGVQFAAPGNTHYFDDFQVWIESTTPEQQALFQDQHGKELGAAPLLLQDPDARAVNAAGQKAAVLKFDSGADVVRAFHADEGTPAALLDWNQKGTIIGDPGWSDNLGDRAVLRATRLSAPAVTRALVYEGIGQHTKVRVYQAFEVVAGSDIEYLEIVHNARWNPPDSKWYADVNTQRATKTALRRDAEIVQTKDDANTGVPWLDSAWDHTPLRQNNLLDTAANAQTLARLRTERLALATGTRTLVQDNVGVSFRQRLYHTCASILGVEHEFWELTHNCEWKQSLNAGAGGWIGDLTTVQAMRRVHGNTFTLVQIKDPVLPANWAENAWTRTSEQNLYDAIFRWHVIDGTFWPGFGLQTTAAEARTTRFAVLVPASGISPKALVSETGRAITLGKGRYYHQTDPVAGGEATTWTFNASFDGVNWNKDSALQNATLFAQNSVGFRFQTRVPNAAWADVNWGDPGNDELDLRIGELATPRRISARDSVLRLHTPTTGNTPDNGNTNPTTNIYANTLYPKTIPKGWAALQTDGIGNVNINEGIGIATVTIVGNSLEVTVVANAAFTAANAYAVASNTSYTSGGLVIVTKISATVFRLTVYDTAGLPVNPATTMMAVDYIVIGEQA